MNNALHLLLPREHDESDGIYTYIKRFAGLFTQLYGHIPIEIVDLIMNINTTIATLKTCFLLQI